MTVALIWAQGNGGVIGRDNAIPWHVPEDFRRFRELTTGHPVVMGRRTWESLPPRFRPLPDRVNVVLTTDPAWTATGAVVAHDLDDALRRAADAAVDDITTVIGGSQIYTAAMPLADQLYVTEIDIDVDGGDIFAPTIDAVTWTSEPGDWMTSQKGLRYRFRDYHRIDA